MTGNTTIREVGTDDLSGLLAIYPLAFPDEDLRPIVTDLITGDADVLSLAAYDGDAPVGHILFTILDGTAKTDARAGALLGPLCVRPDRQGQGLGSGLVTTGLDRLTQRRTRQVFVLGDPAYYGRFGFQAEPDVLPPYPLPAEWTTAWQSLLLPGAAPLKAGKCRLPDPWMQPALWLP